MQMSHIKLFFISFVSHLISRALKLFLYDFDTLWLMKRGSKILFIISLSPHAITLEALQQVPITL